VLSAATYHHAHCTPCQQAFSVIISFFARFFGEALLMGL